MNAKLSWQLFLLCHESRANPLLIEFDIHIRDWRVEFILNLPVVARVCRFQVISSFHLCKWHRSEVDTDSMIDSPAIVILISALGLILSRLATVKRGCWT